MAHSKKNNQLTTTDIILTGAVVAPIGALVGGISGGLGKCAVSFFNPAMASAAGSFLTFAAVGAIAAPLMILPKLITDYLINKSHFLNKHQNLKEFLENTSTFLLTLGAVAASAAILGTPIGPTIICMMVIPAVLYAINAICSAINAFFNPDEVKDDEPTPCCP